MPDFLTGDELGNIKSLRYSPNATSGSQTELKTLRTGKIINGKPYAVQALALSSRQLAVANADGSLQLHSLDGDRLETVQEWRESRFQAKPQFVGLRIFARNVYSCTSDGALRRTTIPDNGDETPSHQLAILPTHLRAWRQSSDEETFAYGGDEVDLSLWNTERAFSPVQEEISSALPVSKKRKRGNELLSGEIWRARNVPHDSLNLRQPVQITSLTYISPSPSASHQDFITGSLLGDVRRYDTRAARRPVADWKGIGKIGGVKVVEKGLSDHEAFVADGGSNLFALDLRIGRVLYGYKGISGAVNSIAPARDFMASTSLDRAVRIHSTYPPADRGTRQEKRGEVLQKVFMNSIPTVMLWDQDSPLNSLPDGDEDDVWESLQHVDDEGTR